MLLCCLQLPMQGEVLTDTTDQHHGFARKVVQSTVENGNMLSQEALEVTVRKIKKRKERSNTF
jgi:hypothetical protein